MAETKKFEAILQFGGQFASSFKTVFDKANERIKGTQEQIRKLKRDQADLNREINKTGEGGAGYDTLKKKAASLEHQLKSLQTQQEKNRVTFDLYNRSVAQAQMFKQNMLSGASTAMWAAGPVLGSIKRSAQYEAEAFNSQIRSQISGGNIGLTKDVEQRILDKAVKYALDPQKALETYTYVASMNMGADEKKGPKYTETIAENSMRAAYALGEDGHGIAELLYNAFGPMQISLDKATEATDLLAQMWHDGHFNAWGSEFPRVMASAARLGATGLDGMAFTGAWLQWNRKVAGTDPLARVWTEQAFTKVLQPTLAKKAGQMVVSVDSNIQSGGESLGVDVNSILTDALHNHKNGMLELAKVLQPLLRDPITGKTDPNKLKQLMGGSYAPNGFTVLLDHLDDILKDADRMMKESPGYINKGIGGRDALGQSDIDRMSASIKVFSASIGDDLKPAVHGFAQAILPLTKALTTGARSDYGALAVGIGGAAASVMTAGWFARNAAGWGSSMLAKMGLKSALAGAAPGVVDAVLKMRWVGFLRNVLTLLMAPEVFALAGLGLGTMWVMNSARKRAEDGDAKVANMLGGWDTGGDQVHASALATARKYDKSSGNHGLAGFEAPVLPADGTIPLPPLTVAQRAGAAPIVQNNTIIVNGTSDPHATGKAAAGAIPQVPVPKNWNSSSLADSHQ